MSHLLAIDPSLTCSGWALFSTLNQNLLALGKIRTIGPRYPLAERLSTLQANVRELIVQAKLGGKDILICEAPTTMRDPSAAIKVEQVRSVFEVIAREYFVQVPGRINPRSVQYELLGMRGKQVKRELVKESARSLVASLYAEALKNFGLPIEVQKLKVHQDLVDAILIGRLGLSKIHSAKVSKEPLAVFFQTTNGRGQHKPCLYHF